MRSSYSTLPQAISFFLGWALQSLLVTLYVFLGGIVLLTIVSRQLSRSEANSLIHWAGCRSSMARL